MRFASTHTVWPVLLAIWLIGGPVGARAQQAATTPPASGAQTLISSDPENPELAAKMNAFNASLAPEHSLQDTITAPPEFRRAFDRNSQPNRSPLIYVPAPTMNSREARKLLDRQKNWAFMTEKDYSQEKSMDDISGMGNLNRRFSSSTLLERFYREKTGGKQKGDKTDPKDNQDGDDQDQTQNQDQSQNPDQDDNLANGKDKDGKTDKKKDKDGKNKDTDLKPVNYFATEKYESPFTEKSSSWGLAKVMGLDDHAADGKDSGQIDVRNSGGSSVSAIFDNAALSGTLTPTPNIADSPFKAPVSLPAPAFLPPPSSSSLGAQPSGLGQLAQPVAISTTFSAPASSYVPPLQTAPVLSPIAARIAAPPPTFTMPKRTF